MAKPALDLPVHSPVSWPTLDTSFARRAIGNREARRLGTLFEDAERQARERIEEARAEAEAIFEAAREEAYAILQVLPDFAALAATPAKKGKTAFSVMRQVADHHGVAFAALTGDRGPDHARVARREAKLAVIQQCPMLTDTDIASLFHVSATAINNLRRGKS